LTQLTKRLMQRALEVELTDHLDYEPHGSRLVARRTSATVSQPEDGADRARAGGDPHATGSRREF
jgi:hypothetical protein